MHFNDHITMSEVMDLLIRSFLHLTLSFCANCCEWTMCNGMKVRILKSDHHACICQQLSLLIYACQMERFTFSGSILRIE